MLDISNEQSLMRGALGRGRSPVSCRRGEVLLRAEGRDAAGHFGQSPCIPSFLSARQGIFHRHESSSVSSRRTRRGKALASFADAASAKDRRVAADMPTRRRIRTCRSLVAAAEARIASTAADRFAVGPSQTLSQCLGVNLHASIRDIMSKCGHGSPGGHVDG